MKLFTFIFGLFLVLASGRIYASVQLSDYEDPQNACYRDCTPWMQELLAKFENRGVLPQLESAVYSGECHHLSSDYDSQHTHYAVVMIDKKLEGGIESFYFSTIFSFFAESNSYASWTLSDSRKNMNSAWKNYGNIIQGQRSARVEIKFDNGSPAYTYWLRQDPKSGNLYYITYTGAGGSQMKSFCELKKNI